jgi:2-haloacid dehalogenase
LYPEKGEMIRKLWRKKQLEYSFIRQLMGKYKPFLSITNEALNYALKENSKN